MIETIKRYSRSLGILFSRYPRCAIGLSALIVRIIPAYIFYGSIDVSAFIGIHVHTLNDTLKFYPAAIWCSFPVIPFYLWLCGLLSIVTSLPLAFCFKTIPIFFDALLAVLLFDILRHIRPQHALRSGLLYALSPIAIIITCIHGQWEALPIFFFVLALYVRTCFQDSYKKYFIYGALFAFAFLLKPLPVLFSLFFFVPWASFKEQLGYLYTIFIGIGLTALVLISAVFVACKINHALSLSVCIGVIRPLLPYLLMMGVGMIIAAGAFLLYAKPCLAWMPDFRQYCGYQVTGVIGALAMVSLCFVFLTAYGFNVLCMIDKVLRYFNQGIQTCGLPFGYPFNQGICAIILKNRFWMMAVIAFFAVLYYREKLDIFHAVLASLMLIFGAGGVSPQYLLWAVPFLLITGFYRIAALFSLICTTFFFVYYMHPLTNPIVPYQSMLSFAALKPYAWLMPPLCLTQDWSLFLVKLLGNYVLPMMCLGTLGAILWYVHSGSLQLTVVQKQPLLIRHNWYLILSGGLTASIALLMVTVCKHHHAEIFRYRYAQVLNSYDVVRIDSYVSGAYGRLTWCNIIFVLGMLAIVWSFAVWRISKKNLP